MRRFVFSSVVALACVLPSPPAYAEDPPRGAAPSPEQVEEARRLFRVGVSLLEDPDGAKYEEARAQFQRAYELSGNWKVLANLGLCQLKLERDGEAVASYEKYLSEGGKNIDPDERAQVERDLGVLKAQVVSVKLTFPAGGIDFTDQRTDSRGNKIINAYKATADTMSIGVHPGDHVFTARLPGRSVNWETALAPGSQAEHKFEAAPEQAASPSPQGSDASGLHGTETGGPADQGTGTRPIPTGVWVGAAATGALAVGAVVTGVMALGARSDFNAINDGTHSLAEKNDAHDKATSLALVNTIISGAAVVGAGVTAYLFFTRPTEHPTEARTVVAPWVTSNGGGLAVGGVL